MNDLFRRKPAKPELDVAVETQPSICEFDIDSILIGKDRLRGGDDDDIPALAASIKEIGQLQPILVRIGDNMLIAGGRRIQACRVLGKTTILTHFLNAKDADEMLRIEADENLKRKNFSFVQTMKYVEKLEENIASKREAGDEDVSGEKTRDIVSRAIGWSEKKLRDAKSIIQNAIPEVIQAIGSDSGDGGLSVNGAYRISQLPQNQQLQALNDAASDLSNEGDVLTKHNTARRKTKRQEKTQTPAKFKPHPIYRIVRVAPDWNNELNSDIQEIPVLSYMAPDSYCIVEVGGLNFQRAMDALSAWGLIVDSIITVWAPRFNKGNVGFALWRQSPYYIIVAHNGDNQYCCPRDAGINCVRPMPVIEMDKRINSMSEIEEKLLDIINGIFPSEEKRICMSSPEKNGKWISWKSSYGFTGDDPLEEEENGTGVLIDEMIEEAEEKGVFRRVAPKSPDEECVPELEIDQADAEEEIRLLDK